MNKNLILLLLIVLNGCGIIHSDRKKESVQVSSKNVSEIKVDWEGSAKDAEKFPEEKLVVSIDAYIKKYKPGEQDGPVISVTGKELSRLKDAWATRGEEHNVLAARFARADEAIAEGLYFPPEGGQHNQWYQCDSCQRGLTTIDAHHHQCPICMKIYSGFPFDNVLYNRKHSQNLRSAEDAAWAWIVTGEKKYAEYAAAVLSGYAERYLKYPMLHTQVNDKSIDVAAGKDGKYRTAGHLQAQTLDEANALIPSAIAYDLINNSGVLSDDQKIKIENDYLRAMADCMNAYKSGKSNWQTWHNAALLYTGAVMGDGDMIRQALLDDKNGFTAQMKISVLPEGMWYENSWGYHYYTLSAMTIIAEGCRRLGLDIYNFPALKKMYFIAFDYLMADGSLPRFGDAVQDSPARQAVNEKAYAVYKDDRLLSTLSSGITWDAIVAGRDMTKKAVLQPSGSKMIPGAGHGILATNGPGKLTAAISFGPFGGFHGHYDKNSFVFFGFGKELGVDPGRSASQAYRLPIHREWYKATTGHNIVLANGKSQNEAQGRCLAYCSTDAYAAITSDAGPAFENISHVRFLLLSPDYLLIVDELKSADGSGHSYDWLYHNKGRSVSCDLPISDTRPGNSPEGYAYLKDISAYKSSNDQPVKIMFNGESTNVNMVMAGQEGDEIFTASGPFTSVEDRVPMVIVRRKGQTVRFVTLLEPVVSGGKSGIEKISLLSRPPSVSVVVTRTDGEEYVSFPEGSLNTFIIQKKAGSGSEFLLQSSGEIKITDRQ